jgi:hypothetical protein
MGYRPTTALVSNANELGQFGVLVCIASVTCMLAYKTALLRLFSIVPLICGFYIIAASGSRTAMVGLGAATVALYFYQFRHAGRKSVGRKIMLVVLGVGVCVGTVYFVIKSPFFYRLADRFSSVASMQEELRYQYFVRALEATASSPLVGLGMGGFALARLGRTATGMAHYSHSSVSETLSCQGIPGFLLFFGSRLAFYLLIRRTRKLPLPNADYGAVNMLMCFFWAITVFDIVAVTFQHRLFCPLTGAACGYLWYLNRQYGRPALETAA